MKVEPTDEEFKSVLNSPSETQKIEFKETLDLSDKSGKAKFAKHVCALCNSGGGWIIFGRKDAGGFIKECPPEFEFITTETVNSISKEFISPPPECVVKFFRPDNWAIDMPVVFVPPFDVSPVIAIKNGPKDSSGKSYVGVVKNAIYIRSTLPESIQVNSSTHLQMLFQKWYEKNPRLKLPNYKDIKAESNESENTLLQNYSIPEIINLAAENRKLATYPAEDLRPQNGQLAPKFTSHSNPREIALIALVGSWSDSNINDIKVLSEFLGMNYQNDWLPIAAELMNTPDSPLSVNEGIWTVSNRLEILKNFGSRIFDTDLENFKFQIKKVLHTLDFKFDNSNSQGTESLSNGGNAKFSRRIRIGISEGLAIVGNCGSYFSSCSSTKTRDVPQLVVRNLLDGADWRKWISLDYLLSNLAEASPKEYLRQVKSALERIPCPFDDIFTQEAKAHIRGSYIFGLLRSLEALAWSEEYIIESICLLGKLAIHDPSDMNSSHALKSIVKILLPWYPQTRASLKHKQLTLEILLTETPDSGWNALLKLLPNQQTSSAGTYKPRYCQKIQQDFDNDVTKEEYWEQIESYSKLAIHEAGMFIDRNANLIDMLGDLPESAFSEYIRKLETDDIQSLPEEERKIIWEGLMKISTKHIQFNHTNWAMSKEKIEQIEHVSNILAPESIFNKYQRLFSERDTSLYESRGNLIGQQTLLDEKRQNAVKELLAKEGLASIVEFAKEVVSPYTVGQALGGVSDKEIDKRLLPEFLISESDSVKSFLTAYIEQRQSAGGWNWVDNTLGDNWTLDQQYLFFLKLPFVRETWDRVKKCLKGGEPLYWRNISMPRSFPDSEIEYAIDNFIENDRPVAAITGFYELLKKSSEPDVNKCIRTLMEAAGSNETKGPFFSLEVCDLIAYLQERPDVDMKKLMILEIAYSDLLDDNYESGLKAIDRKIATDPEFFCELLKIAHRSDGEKIEKNDDSELEIYSRNAFRLLYDWKMIPGMDKEGNFDSERTKKWIDQVKQICNDTGYLETALEHIGRVLIHTPAESNGFWINHTVAQILNERENEAMRNGYQTATITDRSTRIIDSTDNVQRELAQKFSIRANSLVDSNYYMFAQTLLNISEYYDNLVNQVDIISNKFNKYNVDNNTHVFL